jgi:hypothetical protein
MGLTKTHARNRSTESPILFRSCGHETPSSDQKGHQKSGIPCSARNDTTMRCSLDGRLRSFVKYLQDGSNKTHARDYSTMRCSLDGTEHGIPDFRCPLFRALRWNAVFFCNIFARWVLQKHTHANDTTMRCSLDGMLCSFVKYLQDGSYKSTRTR